MKQTKSGFVLPTILIVGTVLFFILAYALNAVVTSQGLITISHRQMLARQAAESGIAYARSCIIKYNRTVKWTEAKPLRPNTDCIGNVQTNLSPYVENNDTYRSFFEVRPSDIADSYKTVSALGKIELLKKPSGQVKSLHDFRMSAYIKTDVTFDDVVFGSLYVGRGYNDLYSRVGQTAGFSRSVYFFTKTHLGKIASVGYNMDGVLTGYKDHNVIPWAHNSTSDPKIQYETPYDLPYPNASSLISIRKIITDFQGNGWITFFLGEDGRTVYGTGSNINCDLGTGNCTGGDGNDPASRPIWLLGESKMNLSNVPADEKVVDIKYNSSTFILTDKGKLFAAGYSALGPGMGSSFANTPTRVSKPSRVWGRNDFNNKVVKTIYTDSYYHYSDGSLAVATTEDGLLYAWGRGTATSIQAGLNAEPRLVLQPGYQALGKVAGKVVDAVTDGGTIWAIDDLGQVWSIGNNTYGQVGAGYDYRFINVFVPLSFPNSEKVVKIAADGFSVLFLTEDGQVYGAGLNNKSQLGFDRNVERCLVTVAQGVSTYTPCSKTPRSYVLPSDKAAQDIFIVSPGIHRNYYGSQSYELEAENYRNSFVITTDGEVYGAGSNRHGQLGVGSACYGESGYDANPQEFAEPQKMKLDYNQNASGTPGDEDKVVRAKYVRSGIGTTIVITDLNHVFTVGNNTNGQLGSGDTKECHIPKRHRYTNVFQTWYY